MNYAYGRVSAADQNLARQIDSFLALGIAKRQIYTDKKSGKNFERENYKKLIRKLKSGDLLVIKSIDRLGRNYDMIIEEWRRITKTIGADILVLDMPLLDTRVNSGNLTGRLISDIVLQLLSYVAQQERENIKARQKEGIAAAKKRGTRFGRPTVPAPENFADTVFAYKQKRISLTEALSRTHLKQATFYNLIRSHLRSDAPELQQNSAIHNDTASAVPEDIFDSQQSETKTDTTVFSSSLSHACACYTTRAFSYALPTPRGGTHAL